MPFHCFRLPSLHCSGAKDLFATVLQFLCRILQTVCSAIATALQRSHCNCCAVLLQYIFFCSATAKVCSSFCSSNALIVQSYEITRLLIGSAVLWPVSIVGVLYQYLFDLSISVQAEAAAHSCPVIFSGSFSTFW